MLTLVLDAALSACSAALVEGEHVLAERVVAGGHGQAGVLPGLAEELLRDAAPGRVAVTVGPGSFTGLRAALSLAHGIAMGRGVPLVGVSLGEAFAQMLPELHGRVLWTAIDSRREQMFIEIDGRVHSLPAGQILPPGVPVAVAGDGATAVASLLAARGADVMLTSARSVRPWAVARAAGLRLSGALGPREAVPIYVAPAATRPPGQPPRPPPA